MSLDKAIQRGKEHRKPYRGAKAISKSCRNHGSCPYCENGRKHKDLRRCWDDWEEEIVLEETAIEEASAVEQI